MIVVGNLTPQPWTILSSSSGLSERGTYFISCDERLDCLLARPRETKHVRWNLREKIEKS